MRHFVGVVPSYRVPPKVVDPVVESVAVVVASMHIARHDTCPELQKKPVQIPFDRPVSAVNYLQAYIFPEPDRTQEAPLAGRVDATIESREIARVVGMRKPVAAACRSQGGEKLGSCVFEAVHQNPPESSA